MIVISVQLWSANDGSKSELARMHICNDGTSAGALRNYIARTMRGRSTAQLDRLHVQREGVVRDWPAEATHVWNLVATALRVMGYGARQGAA